MSKNRHKPEEIVAKLRSVEVMVSQGQSVANAVRAIGVTEVTYREAHSSKVRLFLDGSPRGGKAE